MATLVPVRRFLDVLFQHLRWLALGLVALPAAAGALTFVRNDPSVVIARIRVDPAAFLGEALSDVLPSNQAPADAAAQLIGQLTRTDWFSESLIASGARDASSRSSTPEARRVELQRLRTRLQAVADGPSMIVLRFVSDRPERDLALVGALVGAFRDALESVETQKAAAALRADSGALERAQLDMQRAVDEAARYAFMEDRTGDELKQDPVYQRLLIAAKVATDHYQSVDSLTDRALVASDALTRVQRQAAVVVDPPRTEGGPRAAIALRSAALVLAGTLATSLLSVYLIALHDPRLRDPDDVRRAVRAACLVTTPAVAPRPPTT